MLLVISPLAERDMEGIADHIARENPRRAASFVRELYGQCKTIASNPLGYRRRPELADDIRSCAHGNYVVFFSVIGKEVMIIRVLHGSRDLEQIFSERSGDF